MGVDRPVSQKHGPAAVLAVPACDRGNRRGGRRESAETVPVRRRLGDPQDRIRADGRHVIGPLDRAGPGLDHDVADRLGGARGVGVLADLLADVQGVARCRRFDILAARPENGGIGVIGRHHLTQNDGGRVAVDILAVRTDPGKLMVGDRRVELDGFHVHAMVGHVVDPFLDDHIVDIDPGHCRGGVVGAVHADLEAIAGSVTNPSDQRHAILAVIGRERDDHRIVGPVQGDRGPGRVVDVRDHALPQVRCVNADSHRGGCRVAGRAVVDGVGEGIGIGIVKTCSRCILDRSPTDDRHGSAVGSRSDCGDSQRFADVGCAGIVGQHIHYGGPAAGRNHEPVVDGRWWVVDVELESADGRVGSVGCRDLDVEVFVEAIGRVDGQGVARER